MYKLLKIGFFALLFISCKSDKGKTQNRQINYFDLQTYFKDKAVEFSKSNPEITKEIMVNKDTEKKKLKIDNWKEELSLFINSDINKIALKNSYGKDSTASRVIYTAKDSDLKTRKITVQFDGQNQVQQILIDNVIDNLLFHGTEELLYIPSQLYQIKKHQKVRFLGEKNYLVKGEF
jgi:hypothetical protein